MEIVYSIILSRPESTLWKWPQREPRNKGNSKSTTTLDHFNSFRMHIPISDLYVEWLKYMKLI